MSLSTSPTVVMVPMALISVTSPSTKPSPVTVTSSLVSGVPSYSLVALSLVRVTSRGVMVREPSVTMKVTLLKFSFVFSKSTAVRPIM